MIEVEKKFTPDDNELKLLLDGAESLGDKFVHDVYYDYPDYTLLKKDIRLRNRNGSFELKIGKSAGVSVELENEKEIASYFNFAINKDFEEFIKKSLVPIMEYSNNRKKFKKEGFNIDVDDMSFGYKMCEIELIVDNEEEVKDAEDKIIEFVKRFGFENKKALTKRKAYFKMVKPEVYKELYGDN